MEVYTGEVIFFIADRGFGFIKWEKDGAMQTDMFVHFSGINAEGYKQLHAGEIVTFSIGKNHDGKPKAIEVEVQRSNEKLLGK